ncbi:MAG: class I SAM-dependent methyltransferase [Chloroflexi bacterium]|nr:class I SAM-dependent methyltransferase [Chloroflexota bacterium]
MLTGVLRQICPPVVWQSLKRIKNNVIVRQNRKRRLRLGESPTQQDLEMYWDPAFAQVLETWGDGNTWNEIQFLLMNCRGKVLDIACGTGNTMEILSRLPGINLYGCDISDYLIRMAVTRGISKNRLEICDATRIAFGDNSFDYSYSIGSLEHFTGAGIVQFVSECHRITRFSSFHEVTVSRSGKDEGWYKTSQSFLNNSVDWWLKIFKSVYAEVYTIDSQWQDDISVGKWFICIKKVPSGK